MQANQSINRLTCKEMATSKHDDRSFIETDFGIGFPFKEVNTGVSLVAALLTQIIWTVFPIMTYLGIPMIANAVRTVTFFRALRVLKYSASIVDFLEIISAAIAAVVATAKNVGAWPRATEDRRRYIFETSNLNCMATFWNIFFDLDVAFYNFQVRHLMAKDRFLDMTTRKLHVLNSRHARTTIFTTKLGTLVLTG